MVGNMKKIAVLVLLACLGLPATAGTAGASEPAAALDGKSDSIARIAAFTACGDLEKLRPALAGGLDRGLTVSEVREVLVQLYAYTGFPRSLNAIHAFMAVLAEREKAGIHDELGKEATPMPADLDRDRYGAETRARLAGQDVVPPPSGYQLFAPAIDSYLKEHLFADIFFRDNLDWKARELATAAALAAMHGTAGQQKFHLGAALNMGWTGEELSRVLDMVGAEVDADLANEARGVLETVLAARAK